jgi:putative flippase GtrA
VSFRSAAALGRSIWSAPFVRFLFVGLLNTMVGYLIYLAVLLADAGPGLALAVATGVGAVFNYFSTGRLVFSHGGLGRLPLFLLAYAVIYLVNLGLLYGLVALGMPPRYGQLVLLPLIAILSYLIFKLAVFRGQVQA